MTKKSDSVPCLLWPFWAIGKLVKTVVAAVGRVIAFVMGLVLMVVGALLTMTIVGAFVGIPLAALGFLLIVRSLF